MLESGTVVSRTGSVTTLSSAGLFFLTLLLGLLDRCVKIKGLIQKQ